MNKKNIIIFTSLALITLFSVLSLKLRIFSDIIPVRGFVYIITTIFAIGAFLTIKSFSKLVAGGAVFLLIALCFLFEKAIISTNGAEIGSIIIITEAFVMVFSYLCSIITKVKIAEKYKTEVGKYVADTILKEIESPSASPADGTRRNMTVMFIDIRGFTTISENLSATEVTEVLNDYFREVVPVITKYNGVVNKFIGDAVLAVFDGQTPAEHAKNAVKAGKTILKRLRTFQGAREILGKQTFQSGIGINTGDVFIGSIGTDERREYAVIGDTVNLASRTEASNRIFKTQFLITENTYQYVSEIADVIKISDVEMRGKKEKVNVYEVLRVSEIEE